MPPRPELALSLQFADARHRPLVPRHLVVRCIRWALERPAQLTVRVVAEVEARQLNRNYRGRDYPTNVLTFDYQHAPIVVADLVLCAPVLEREALQAGRAVVAHYVHLLVHGTLHAQGYDHVRLAEARRMQALEVAVLARLGLPDPYLAPPGTQPPARSSRAASRAK
ncbi:MAG: rRNA maturation RNase YbeY [Aquabacterium sp.]